MVKGESWHALLRKLILAWLVAVLAEYLLLPRQVQTLEGLQGLGEMSLLRILAITAAVFLLLFYLGRLRSFQGAERWGLTAVFAVLAAVSLGTSFTWPFLGACGVILAILVFYGIRGWNSSEEAVAPACDKNKVFLWITLGLTLIYFLFISVWTVCRVYTFSTPTYDFGIFAQMFHNMRISGQPMTTVERDGLLSHFRVHMSPIYYLMLPFYCLVPHPATLQVLQAAVLASSILPLWKLGKLHGLSGLQRMLVCGVLLLYPAFSGGISYDIHENCFLAPLILWLLYSIDRKNTWLIAVFSLLTLTVKEDAAVYVAVIALWLITKTLLHYNKTRRRELFTGVAMLVLSILYFFIVTSYLAKVGDGVMTDRYDNFIYDGSESLITVIKAVLMSPMKAVFECADGEKLKFILLTMGTLLCLPLMTRRYERYILLIPYLLINLMSDYYYQHDIFFQYTFGSTACLMYLVVVNLAELRINWKRVAPLGAAAAINAACLFYVVVPVAAFFPALFLHHQGYYREVRQALAQIPEGVPVASGTFYTSFLSQREILYDVGYCTPEQLLSTEYVVLDSACAYDSEPYEENGGDGYEKLVELLEQNGYTVYLEVQDRIVIFHKAE